MITFANSSVLFKKKKRKYLRFPMLKSMLEYSDQEQLSLYNNGSTVIISKLIVGPIQRVPLDGKVTLRTLWTYDK